MISIVAFFQQESSVIWTMTILVLHMLITLGIVIRVIMSNRSVGASLAWIAVVFMFPVLGPTIYLLIGELRLGSRRVKLVKRLYFYINSVLKLFNLFIGYAYKRVNDRDRKSVV